MSDSLKQTIEKIIGGILDKWSSPMYKVFIVSRSLRNWNFWYTIIFESEKHIIEKSGILKHLYIKELLYKIDRTHIYQKPFFRDGAIYMFGFQSGLWNMILGPIISVIAYFYIIKYCNERITKKDLENNSKINAIKIGESIELKKLETKELEEEKKLLEADFNKKEQENKYQIRKKDNEINSLKKEISIKKESKMDKIKEREDEYIEAESIENFKSAMEYLKELGGGGLDQNKESKILSLCGYIYNLYNLYNISHNNINDYFPGSLTDKGKFFLRKYVAPNFINKELSGGEISEQEIDNNNEGDLPF